ncbi:hypothetical protein D3C72_2469600 [compost metagenome]
MDIAVAEVAEGADSRIGDESHHRRIGLGEEARHARHRHRHVMLDRPALGLLRLRHAFTQVPEGLLLGERRGDHGVLDQPCV